MSTQSLQEHITKKPTSGGLFRAKKSKLQKIQVSPTPALDAKNVGVEEKWPVTENGVFPSMETIEDQRLSTPSRMSGHDNINLEVDETKTLWAKVKHGNKHHQSSFSLPRQHRCCPNEVYVMRFLIAVAFLFSVTNLCLTVMLMRGQKENCACQEKSELLGEVS